VSENKKEITLKRSARVCILYIRYIIHTYIYIRIIGGHCCPVLRETLYCSCHPMCSGAGFGYSVLYNIREGIYIMFLLKGKTYTYN